MKLHEYLESLDEVGRAAFYARLAAVIRLNAKPGRRRNAPTRPVYIAQLATYLRRDPPRPGDRRPSHKLAQWISEASEGNVPPWELRPDIWPAPARVRRKRAAEATT